MINSLHNLAAEFAEDAKKGRISGRAARKLIAVVPVIVALAACSPTETAAPTSTAPPGVSAAATPGQYAAAVSQPPPAAVVFPPGETGVTLEGELPVGGAHSYQVFAQGGQTMTLRISSPSDDVDYTAWGVEDGAPLMPLETSEPGSYPLPATQAYAVRVLSRGESTNYTLTIEIPPLPGAGDCVLSKKGSEPAAWDVYWNASTLWDVYTQAHKGSSFTVLLITLDGWYGVDTGVPGGWGYARLRWIHPGPGTAELSGPCELPVVLSYETVANATYKIFGNVTLVDGEAQALGDGENAGMRQYFLTRTMDYGDLNGNGDLEALAVLRHHQNGTGQFVELVVLAHDGAQARHIAGTGLGDRTIVNRMRVEADGVIELDLTETFSHQFTPSCCGPQDVVVRFRLENGELIKIEAVPDS